MELHTDPRRFAVLIDAVNAQASCVAEVLAEVAKYGITNVRRAYGDWTTNRLAAWKNMLHEHAIQPVQQFSFAAGKNATDSAMIIDAMDLLYKGGLHGFCIVSSDSDFTRLATRLRESGMVVLGFGERHTPRAFVSACDTFVHTEVPPPKKSVSIAARPSPNGRKAAREPRSDAELVSLLKTAAGSEAGDDGWANLSRIGQYLKKHSPDFDPRNYGYARLGQLVQATELFDFEERQSQKYLKDKQRSNKGQARIASGGGSERQKPPAGSTGIASRCGPVDPSAPDETAAPAEIPAAGASSTRAANPGRNGDEIRSLF